MSSTWKPRSIAHLFSTNRTVIIGHRGGGGLAPENTMLAFRNAPKVGADSVEFDVMLSKDRKVIVFHDYTLQKRLYLKGKVRDMTYAELQKIDVSDYYIEHHPLQKVPKAFRPARIPLLEDVLLYYKKYPKFVLNIELKNENLIGDGVEPAVAALLRKHGYQNRVVVSSFNPFAVWRFRKAAPEILRALIFSESNPVYIRNLWLIDLAQPDALHPQGVLVTEAFMAWAKKRGFAVNPWTINQPWKMKKLIGLGVTGMITDYPNLLVKVLQKSK